MRPGEWVETVERAWPILVWAVCSVVGLVRWFIWVHRRAKSVERMERAIPWLVHQLKETADGARRACYNANINHEQLNLVTDMLLDAETGDKGARHVGTLATTDRQAVEQLRALLRVGRK